MSWKFLNNYLINTSENVYSLKVKDFLRFLQMENHKQAELLPADTQEKLGVIKRKVETLNFKKTQQMPRASAAKEVLWCSYIWMDQMFKESGSSAQICTEVQWKSFSPDMIMTDLLPACPTWQIINRFYNTD